MADKPTYEELIKRVKELEKEAFERSSFERNLRIFETAVESSINAIGITDLEGKLTYVNDSCVKMWGYNNKGEILGRFLPEFWEGDGVFKTIKELKEKGVAKGEDVGKRKDGSLLNVQFTASIIKDEAGNPSFMFGSFVDITERKQVEETLRTSHERFLTVLDSIDATIYVADMETHEILFMNKNMKESFGNDMTGEICWDVFRGESEPCQHCTNDQLINENGKPTGVSVWQDKNPLTKKWYINYDRAIEWTDGRLVRLQIATDITDLKRMEKELRQAHKMEAIGTLAGGLAHDFNNLLAIIVGNIELAKDDIKPDVGIFENLKEAEKASFRAKELVKQLITFSKGGEPIKEVSSIGDLVKDTTNLNISGSNARCEFSLPKNLWLAEFDEGQMRYAVKNLINNAIEAMPDGGSIDVVAENVEIDSETAKYSSPFSEGKYIKIAIRDHGVGISEDHLHKIFDPYFSTKEIGVRKGMGMGLATTYNIIDRNDGYITVESEVGIGTTFTLYLPAHEKDIRKLKPVETPKPEKPGVSAGRILVMDDEEAIRNLSKQILGRLGYEPEVAKDGVEVIELYRNAKDSDKPFDAVILNLTIKGGMGGKDTIKVLLEIDPQVKAIVSSGYSNDSVITNFKEYGFIGALVKPYTKKGLRDTLNKVTEQ
jgi:PAS domain S-box-containing protein